MLSQWWILWICSHCKKVKHYKEVIDGVEKVHCINTVSSCRPLFRPYFLEYHVLRAFILFCILVHTILYSGDTGWAV